MMVIRGAAGSGKTTTAILRLRSLIGFYLNRRSRVREASPPVRALVLTFNRTLRGYIDELVRHQVAAAQQIELEVSTFGRWAQQRLGSPAIVDHTQRFEAVRRLGEGIALDPKFLVEEVEYVLGRFLPGDLPHYVQTARTGRGAKPRVGQEVRHQILDLIGRYATWKKKQAVSDWNDLAVRLATKQKTPLYDIIIADECQDFSANELRAINNHLQQDHSLTLIIDSAQRIYARGFSWSEVGIAIRPENARKLSVNYRNTMEIAKLATPLLNGIPADDDATMPDFSKSHRRGRKPVVLQGRFRDQMQWALNYVNQYVPLDRQSVAFLHPQGGNWFQHVKEALEDAGLAYVSLSREDEWPTSDVNVALVTLPSAKGLEFDHVFMLGLNDGNLRAAREDEDRELKLRRMLAMAIGRARDFVAIGYKTGERAAVLSYLDPSTFDLIHL